MIFINLFEFILFVCSSQQIKSLRSTKLFWMLSSIDLCYNHCELKEFITQGAYEHEYKQFKIIHVMLVYSSFI
jgi:hypothetical protein